LFPNSIPNNSSGLIPYYKLHGSIHFKKSGSNIMIMGSSKQDRINEILLLKKYHEDFEEKLRSGDARLMIIGYSFTDYHINKRIFKAVEENNLKFWIIDVMSLGQL